MSHFIRIPVLSKRDSHIKQCNEEKCKKIASSSKEKTPLLLQNHQISKHSSFHFNDGFLLQTSLIERYNNNKKEMPKKMFWKYYFSTSAYVTIPLYNKGKIVKISTVLQVGNIECRR